jgi:cytochrome c
MPLLQYRLIHLSTRITDADIKTLSSWARASGPTEAGSSNQATLDGDPIRGKEVYEKRCTGCHAITSDREGPRLQSVYGRTSGTVPGFDYSPALKQAHVVWNEASLDKWLTDPDTFVPGNNMEFHVPKPQERRDLIRFLKEGAAH